ncbi:hybrid sensor histidine kinase/response regulator [Gloeocapsopsis dulcis]|uniref:Circadian input-output histidine kinase CikA n=1 Tax=Gloeocapsopsis dulcis AAB1 = 1H9 TaxID=1433147 RepID=A0A6N8FXN0_9CHRO|nr:hybrid sensor histidine kinase/response regulator [Gloeocapsopsis dulcis]MUL37382.1 hybrid sensor histidine kinase/response regulator [Gloeocapsopsis dulcis AAB1 = 1H9]WNN88903.1 ATP-binding protein [Gloeocapsopsis dulcis]
MRWLDLSRYLKIANDDVYKNEGIGLHKLLIVPFVLQIFVAVAIVGYISLRNGQLAVNQLADQLMDKVNKLVDQHLNSYLATPHQINQLNVKAVQLGILDVYRFEDAGHYFWKQMQVFDVSYIGYALTTGELVASGRYLDGRGITIDELSSRTQGKAYTYATDSQGNRTTVLRVYENYQPLAEAWYTDTVKARKPTWTAVYTWDEPAEHLLITASCPLYDKNDRLLGVIGADFLLTKISKFLASIDISPTGKIFIIERNGLLIASSSQEKPLTVLQGKAQRLNVLHSQDALMQAMAQHIHDEFGGFAQIKRSQKLNVQYNHKRHFVHVTPWYDSLGLDWLVVTVVPESDFMAQINRNTQMTIALCLLALLVAIIVGLLTSQWIVRPIQKLSIASKAIASGDLNQSVKIEGVKELDVLSQSFNRMALQIKESLEQLEIRVEQRTAELKTAKQASEAASQAKGEFLAKMSHELRTPLNAILGFTKLMHLDASITAEQKENLKIIGRSGEHLLILINDVLDMSKIEAGCSVLNKKKFDLYTLLNSLEEMFQFKAQSKGLQLKVERTGEVPQFVYSDEIKLRQILINLLSNAIKFTPEGYVTVRLQAIEETPKGSPAFKTVYFEVKDTGLGIAPHELAILFEPFVQTETGRKSEQGTGLGLAIAKNFVQLMGGELTVNSQLGKGSSFQFNIRLELADSAEWQQSITRQVIGLALGQPTYRIVVADGHLAHRRILKQMLTNVGFEVREAENGQEAIALCQNWEPHLIWMDIQMPIVSDYEAIKQIKSHPTHQVIIVASAASTLEEDTLLAAGCDDILRKPVREHAIWQKLAQHLGVRYRYQTQRLTSQGEATLHNVLKTDSLNVMSPGWIAELRQAAAKLDAETLLQLINQIPSEHDFLAQALQQKVKNFDFDQLIDLAQSSSSL